MDGWVIISWKTAEYLAVLIGQTNWGNNKRRGPAAEDLGKAMGFNRMETSLECFDIKEDTNSAMKMVAAEKSMILKFLRSKPGTEELVAGIESGEYRKKEK